MKLSVGPILYFWDRATVLAVYESLCEAPVDIAYRATRLDPARDAQLLRRPRFGRFP